MINLLHNPFALLGATVQDPPKAILDAMARAVASGELEEGEARKAALTLRDPSARLDVEVSWLLGRSAPRVAAILAALKEPPDTPGRLALLETIDGVARANLAAHLCAVERGGVSIVRAMVEAQNEISPDAVFWLVNGNRERAGLPPVTAEDLAAALEALQARHCAAACEAIAAREEHRKFMVRLFADGWSPAGRAYTFLERVVATYDAWYDAHLAAIEADLTRYCRRLTAEPGDLDATDGVKQGLALWDEFSHPLIERESKNETVMARADAIHQQVGALCLHLAQNCGRYRTALQVAESLHYAFPEHPRVELNLPEDLNALESILGRLRPDSAPRKLADTLLQLNREPAALAAGLEQGGFGRGDRTPAGALYQAFTGSMAEAYGTASAELIWIMFRALALDLHRRNGHTAAALALLESILAQRDDYDVPAEIRRLLENDAGHLSFAGQRREIEARMERGKWRKAAHVVDALLLDPPTEVAREELVALQATIRDQRAQTSIHRPLVYLALGLLAIVLAVLIFALR